jgi:heterodisulfide reductase subunit A-like polyferredoxin
MITKRQLIMVTTIENEKVGAVMVCGAGIAGIQASLDLAGSGFKVYLLDSTAAIGGRMAHLDKTFPTGDCAICILSPKLVECARNRNIEIITAADIHDISGHAGRFKVKVRQHPRYIDIKKCDACGDCAEACPVNLSNDFDGGLGARKAIFQPYPQAIPNAFAISKADGQAPCTASCPAGVNVQGALSLLAAGKLTEAYELVRRRSPFPASCGRICRHFCQSSCNRKSIDEAVAFGNIERFIGDYVQSHPELYPPYSSATSLSDGKVAVIGGGPAGLTAAADLALMGYGVTLFEAKPQLGGMLRYGIPGYRLPKETLEKEIQSIVDLGVDVKTNTLIAKPKNLLMPNVPSNGSSASAEKFHAVFTATGAWMGHKLDIPGEDAQGVWDALDFLCKANSGETLEIGPNVLVIGSSDPAIDAARSALRLPGVTSVSLACIESRAEMPAGPDQIAQALDEGVIFHNGLGPTRIEAQRDQVSSVLFRACTSVFDNYRGYRRYNPLFDDARISALKSDTVIVAVGRGVDAAPLELNMRPGGRILTDDDTLATSVKGIFAGGDAVLGPASVVHAIAQGHKAAEAIDAYLREAANIRITDGAQILSSKPGHSNAAKYAPNPRPDAPRQDSVRMPQRAVARRLLDMSETDLGYSREQALIEAQRCLSCGLCSGCMQCVKACSAGAILHDQLPAEMEIEVGSIIFAPENEVAYAHTKRSLPLAGASPGIYVARASEERGASQERGGFQEPKDIPESVAQGSAAAACAMEQLSSVRGTMIEQQKYPWERDVADEPPRIGVFVCHCGHNISSVVDVDGIAKKVAKMPNVHHAEACMYTCSDANQQRIRSVIREHRLNRLVVASCSSRTHEALFQETLRESGLNPFLFTMTNIRDQCSWVHRNDPAAATAKAADLVSMAVARARHLKQLPLYELPVTASALILGGGLAGMTAAQIIAGQGFKVHLVERKAFLGGLLRNVRATLENDDVQKYLQQLIDKTQSNPKISVYLNADLIKISGQVGNFASVLNVAGKEIPVEHGVVIVATGGQERPTEKFLHGRNPQVVTQSRLEAMLADESLFPGLGNKENPSIVMIQCVESRDGKNPYCSRVCCAEAVKNALEIKRRWPLSNLVIINRDIQTYGFREVFYQKAIEQGVQFVRYSDNLGPEVMEENGRLAIKVQDCFGRDFVFNPDLLVLSTGISPAIGNPNLSKMLRSALTADGFFSEAHSKLRPVDLANEGEFLCGVAHSPRFMDETIVQAQAAAGRASTILSKAQLEIMGQIALVNPSECVACATCIKICPYGAPTINELKKAEIQSAKCMGCGSCVAACPAKAITLEYQEGETMVAMLNELLVGGGSL